MASAAYYLMRHSSGAIGYDGTGALDFERSEFDGSEADIASLRKMNRLIDRKEIHLRETGGIPNLFMRRAVRPFDLYYSERVNALIVNVRFLDQTALPIAGSVRGLTPVTCHFGARSGDYLFGNLRHYHCRENLIEWEQSTFIQVENSNFQINFTRIEEGRVPRDHEVAYEARGLRFGSAEAFFEAQRNLSLRWLIPENLRLRTDQPCAIVNFSAVMTLIREDVVHALRDARRPKTQVPGMIFAPPRVEVTFAAPEIVP